MQELRTPDTDHVTGCGPEVWRGSSVYTSGYHSVDRLSDIDEFEESCKVGTSRPRRSSLPGSLATDTGDKLCDEISADEEAEAEDIDGVLEEEEEEDDDSTPHIMSETSKTQSPISTGKVSEKSNEKQIEEPLYSSQEEDEIIENFNQGETGTSLAEELALQIELESDKSRSNGEGAEVEGNLLQSDEINAKQFWDNKISQQTFQHNIKAELNGEEHGPAASLETKTDFGIVLGKL